MKTKAEWSKWHHRQVCPECGWFDKPLFPSSKHDMFFAINWYASYPVCPCPECGGEPKECIVRLLVEYVWKGLIFKYWFPEKVLDIERKKPRKADSEGGIMGHRSNENGTPLSSQIILLEARNLELSEEVQRLRREKDGAYLERNLMVAALSKHYPSGTARTAIEGWSEDWHGCVYIDLPDGQVSWHYHDSQAHLFAHLPPYEGKWDGHTTPEKYHRLGLLEAKAKQMEPKNDPA